MNFARLNGPAMFRCLRGGLIPEDPLVFDIGLGLAAAMMRHDGLGLAGPCRRPANRGAASQSGEHGSEESGAFATPSHDTTSSKQKKLITGPAALVHGGGTALTMSRRRGSIAINSTLSGNYETVAFLPASFSLRDVSRCNRGM